MNVYDVVPAACTEMKAKGSTVCSSVGEVAQTSDYVITMLPNHDIVSETYNKIVETGVNPNTFFVDSSTIDPNVAKQVIKRLMTAILHLVLIYVLFDIF